MIVSATTFRRTACTNARREEILLSLAESWSQPRTECAVILPRGVPNEALFLPPNKFNAVNYSCEYVAP